MIVESSFDFDTSTIGPYKIPEQLPYSQEFAGNVLPHHSLYTEMLKSRDILAVVDVNGLLFGIIERDRCYLIDTRDNMEYRHKVFKAPLPIPEYQHIGYRKTYPKTLSVYHYPWYLLQDVKTGEVLDFEGIKVSSPLVEPHVGLYKNLVDTSYEAIYFDTSNNCITYL